MILLHCEGSHGSAVLPASLVEGRSAEERRYQIADHFMEVEAGDEVVTAHDAEELCGHAGFRLATAEEQDAYTASKKKKTSVRERAAAATPAAAPAIEAAAQGAQGG